MVPCCGTPILPYLYLGDESDASDPDKLKSHNIYYVLNVTVDLPGEGVNGPIRYKRIPVSDSVDQNLVQYFEEAFQFIEEARKAERAVLIHCHAGISRSPTIVVAYLMFSQNMNFDCAYKFVVSKRPIIDPNFAFVGQLHEYENSQLKTTLPNSLPVSTQTISSTTPTGNTVQISKPVSTLTLTSLMASTMTTSTSTSTSSTITTTTTKTNSSPPSLSSSPLTSTISSTTTTTMTTSISAPTTPTTPMALPLLTPTTPILTTMPTTPSTPTSRSYLKIIDTLNKQPFFLQPPPRPPTNLSLKEGNTKPDFPSSCEALSDIPYNSLGPVRGCRSRKSCNNDFILLRPIKMTKNTRVK